MQPGHQVELSELQDCRVRNEMGYADRLQRRQDSAEHVPGPEGLYVEWGAPEDGILAAEQAAGKFTTVGSSSHIVLVGNDGVPHEHALIRASQLDATISQPANSYAQYAVFYARAALEGKTYSAGQATDHK